MANKLLGILLAAAVGATCLVPASGLAARGDCGQPGTDGSVPTAADCLLILRAAVEVYTCSPACICDVGAPFGITATDSLLCLKKAVGETVQLVCHCPVTTTSSSTVSTSTSSTITLAPGDPTAEFGITELAADPGHQLLGSGRTVADAICRLPQRL